MTINAHQSLYEPRLATDVAPGESMGGPRIVFSGGGTLGHLLPGLALAGEIRALRPDAQITFCGAGRSLGRHESEQRYVDRAGYDYRPISCEPLPRGPLQAARFVSRNLHGYAAASRLLRRLRAGAVVGLGGYASAPVARAAVRLKVPLVLLEQNVLPGKANRWLAPAARLVCAAWSDSLAEFPTAARCCLTGIPLRTEFEIAAPAYENRPRRLLVLGGTAGARSLNEAVPATLARLGARFLGWEVLHQAGEGQVSAAQAIYDRLGIPARVVPRIANVAAAMSSASFAVCRAGGATLAELAASGLPALLVPYPRATDGHQRRNAQALTASEGCLLLEEPGTMPLVDRMAPLLLDALSDAPRRARMSAALSRLARPYAGRLVAELVLGMIRPHREQRSRIAAGAPHQP